MRIMHTNISRHSFPRRDAQQKTDIVFCITWVLGPTDDLHVLLPLQQCSQGFLVFIHKLASIPPNVALGKIDVAIHVPKAQGQCHDSNLCCGIDPFLYSFCMRLCTIYPWWVVGVWLTPNYSVLKPIILLSQICNIASQTALLGESFQTLCIGWSTVYLSITCVGGSIAAFWIRWTWLLKMFLK